jgi:N-acetylglucosamine-6-phosphate deacetylase
VAVARGKSWAILIKIQKKIIMLTQIINARILTPQGWLKDGSVIIRDNKILEVTNCDLAVIGAQVIDAKGLYVVPGRPNTY